MVYTIMIDPFNKQRKYLLWSFILIVFLIVTGIATAGEKSEWLNDNPCIIKVVINEKDFINNEFCFTY